MRKASLAAAFSDFVSLPKSSQSKRKNRLGLVGNNATFIHKFRQAVIQALSLVLIVSTLSAISIVTAPTASAAQDAECVIGSSSSCPATSPQEIFNLYGTTTDGTYWLRVNGEARQTFLIMNTSAPDGGMWFLGMKAPKGSTTFKNNSLSWTDQNSVTGTTSLSNDVAADAKFHAFNHLPVVKVVAVFRDRDSFNFNSSGSGDLGANNWFTGHTWQETITEQSMFTRFTTNQNLIDQNGNQTTYRTRDTLLRETNSASGKLVFPYQTGWSRYGFNNSTGYSYRWGVTFNNETSMGSNDTGSGIGMSDYSAAAQVSYSDGFTVGPSSSTTSGVSNPGTFVYPSGFQIWGKTPNPSLAAPASLSASIPAAGQVNLSWATFSGATDYVVQYKTAVASSYSNSFLVSGQTTASITGLTSNTSYNFRVFARTATNSTSSANIANSTITATPQTTPSAPSITGITPGNTTLSVAFNPPSTDGGATITNYQYSTDGGLNWRTRDSGTTGSPLVINTTSAASPVTLRSGTTYNVQIRAVNSVGNGAATSSTAGTPTFPSCSPSSTSSGGFTILTFTSTTTCNWAVPNGVTSADVLVVGGGGGAGHNSGGGGGGGGVYYQTSVAVSGNATVTVGAGGAAGSASGSGTNGSQSSFGSTTVNGGNAGIGYSTPSGDRPAGKAQSDGGNSVAGSGLAGASGAGGNGTRTDTAAGSAGSAGPSISITGTATNYAGGGGGGGWTTLTNGGAGGAGGGGAGGGKVGSIVNGTAGNANTGGGGGSGSTSGSTSGAGGSGVVIVRYAMATLTPTFGTPTATATGFTVQITNFNTGYTWSGTATENGSVAVSDTGLVTVTGVAPGTLSTATITNTTASYTGASATVSATSTAGSAFNPTFGTPTVTADGFTVQISNYSNSYTWAGTASASGIVSVSGTGLVTVTGVAANTSSTATITTTRTGYTGGSATVSATSLPTCSPTSVSSGGFTTLTFTNSSSCAWTTPSGISTATVLVVGGGGGGGADGGGGGGGGGVAENNNFSLTANGTYTVTVGQGGSGGNGYKSGATCSGNFLGWSSIAVGCDGATGGTSALGSISASGGGGGGGIESSGLADSNAAATARGGGGGAGAQNDKAETGSAGVGGFTGGTVLNGAGNAAGGGASASANGSNGSSTLAGAGAAGVAAALNSIVYGSGGAGGSYNNATAALGGTNAGNGGSQDIGPTTPVANRGGGGGGGGNGTTQNNAIGTAGAAGVVIVRYLNAPVISIASSPVTAVVGTAVTSYSISNSGGAAASYSISPALAVSGLTFSTSTGLISGTPAADASSATYTITATNASGTSTATFSLAVSLSCAAGGVCVVGDTGPGGGIVFYVEPNNGTFACGQSLSSLCKYLEAAPITGATAWTDARYAWSGNVNTAIGTTSTAIGTGYSNTLKMVTQIGAGTSGAGSATRNYRGGGLNDWYLPSKDELNELYINRTVASATDGYWSSSEYNATGAWDQGFGNGSQGVADPGKQQTTPVRPIRAFGSSAVESAIIYVPAIAGVTAPVRGATPVTTVTAANGYTGTVTWSSSPSTFAAATTYTATITLTAASGFTLTGVTANFFTVSGATSVTHLANSGIITAVFPATAASPALTPAFGSPTATADGFTVQISNYSSDYTWAGSATASGSVAISDSGLVTVTGVASGTSATATITTTRTGYTGGSATVSATSITGSALTPTFGSTTAKADGFTVQISNYSSDYTWAGSATASGSVSINGSGLVTVTGVAPGTSSTATITTTRTGYTGGSATVSATSITGSALTPTFGSTTAKADGFTVQISNYSSSYTWGGTATASGSVAISETGLVTVTGVALGTSSTATITTTRTGYTGGSATVSATSLSACSVSSTTASGYTTLRITSVGSCVWTTPSGVTTAEVLVVGGGGGGGGAHDNSTSGGGGAGYVYANSTESISGNILISVGAGGTGGVGVTTGTPQNGNSGGNSTFGSVTALGGAGGFGGYESWTGACPTYSTPVEGGTAATLSQAATGGQDGCFNRNGFGGGGQSSTTNQTGGAGIANSITGTSVTYGTGGTGGTDNADVTPTAQPSNTGNGGTGAASRASFGRTGGAGGSGVVIIRYLNAPAITLSTSTISATVGNAITSYTISNSGGSASSYSISPELSTAGLSFNTSTGLISGTPSATLTSTSYTITATNSSGTSTATFSLTVSISCAAGGVCVVGDTGPGGGIVFYVAPSGGTFACGQSRTSTCKYLEAASITAGNFYAINSNQYFWSGNQNTAIGTTLSDIGAGYSNTLQMVRQSGAGTAGAGSAARNWRGGGLNDWYLPSRLELYQLYLNRSITGTTLGFMSSTEANATSYFYEIGTGGTAGAGESKGQSRFIRPIRAFGSSAVESAIIYVPAIAGVTAPVRGATPVTTVTAANGYTGTVSWSGSPSTFAGATTYTATITLTAASGFTLTGVTANFFTVSGTTSVTHSADSGTITAVFPATEATVQTITYAAGTGGTGSAPTSPTTVSNGSTFTTPANTYTRTGYTFAGWNDGTATYAEAATYPSTGTVSGNVTLTATWTANSNTFIFDANTGTGSMANQSIASGTSTALTTNSFTKTGHTFAGWNTLAGGGGTSYTNGQSITITSGATLYAQWTLNSNTFGYNGNSSSGGSTPTGGGSKSFGSTITVAANTFTRTGYTFTNWNTAADGSGTTYADTGSVTFTMPDAAVTLYAQWSIVLCTPTTSISGGFKVFTFTNTSVCFWNVPSDASAVDVLVVGGGGGGAGNKTPRTYDGAGAGGGGGAYLANSVNITGAVEIIAGAGGAGGTTTSTGSGATGSQGSQSYFATITAGGGGGGGCDNTAGLNLACNTAAMSGATGTAGGGGGGASNYYNAYSFGNGGTGSNVTIGGTTYSAQNGFRGGYYNDGGASATTTAGPGGGARSAANRNTPGSGLVSSFTGTSAEYGKGGSAHGVASWTFRSTASGYGTGGDGAYHASAATNGAAGANGVVIVRYAIPSITYLAGTSGNGSAPTTPTAVDFGATFTTPANTFTRSGYTFAGWSDGTNTYAAGVTYPTSGSVNANVTLTATWTADSNTVVFDNNTGSGTMANQSITSAVATALTTNTFTKAGYTFAGWNTLANGTGTSYTDGQSITITAGATLYAQWTVNTNNFAYNGNTSDGGSTPAASASTNYGATVTVAANTFTKTGYIFANWNTAANGSGTTYAGTGSVTFTMPDAAVTLYAQWTADSNTFIFNNNTGSGTMADQSITSGTATALTTNTFTKTGYTFAGWNTVAGGGGTSYTDGESITVTAGTTLYAQWTADSNTFIFNNNTGSGTMADQSITSGTATALTTNTFTKTGYTFAGWNTVAGGGGTSYTDGESITVTAGTTLYAQWTVNGNTFAYNGNTSDGGTTPTGGGSINFAATVTVATNTFTKTGYTFTGWNTAANGSGTPYAATGSVTFLMPDAAVTLYAQWTIISSAFAYNGNTSDGGSAPSGGGDNDYGTTITVAANSYTKTGHTFSGWNTAANGSGTSYAGTGLITFAMPDTAVTLYAQWTANTNSLTYNGNTNTGGSTPSGGGSKNFGTTITVAANTFTKTGYTFTAWNTAANGSGTSYDGTGSITFVMPDASVTLYAQWSANTLVVTFNAQGGTTVTAGSTFTAGSIAAAPTAPTKSNYTFTGWATSVDGSAIEFEYTHGQTADFTLYALWAANVYTVTYVYNSATGGNSAVSDTFTTGGTAITLPTPTRTGYTFAGWHSDSLFATSIGLAGASYSPTGSALSLSAYAKWTAIDYTVTYSAATKTSGAVPVDSANYIYATNVLIKGNTGSLVRTGYTFLGWTSAADGSSTLLTSGSTFSTPAANMTFYAKWSANTYTVTYNKNGASGSPVTATDSYTTGGTAITLTAVGTMVKTGFDFAGWSATPTGSVITGTYTTAVDTTLYAIWTIKSISISFAKGSAINESFFNFPTNRSADYGTLITLSDTVDSSIDIAGVSHAFMGWNDGNSVYQSGATYLLGETAPTFTAVWVKIYAVRYGFNGGTAASGSSAIDGECLQLGSTCTNGQVITSNAAPSKTGYDFAGWVDQNNQSVPTAGTFTVSATRYLIYATWTPINYAITYNAGGGATTPASFTKQISQSFSTADAITRVGYTFNGWSDGTSVYGAGATYYVASSPVTLTAQWVANVYTVSYDWNGGSGSSTADASYTVGTTAITLPLVGDHVKDGYNFAGWSTSPTGDLISGGYTPTADTTLFAIWGTGSYTVTYDYNWGSVSNTSASVLNGTSLTLPTPTRANFVFDGWYTARTSGSKVGNAGTSHQPTGSKTLYARWIQSSLFGIEPASLLRLGQTTARDAAQATFIGENATSAVSVTVPAGSLPDGTIVYFDLVGDFTRARTLLSTDNSYIISMVVSWLAPDETVPDTNAGKAISLTIENDSIKAGASIYAIVADQATLLTTATQNGIVTVALTSDPEVVVIATKPNAPASVEASSNGVRQSVVSWNPPASDGGSAITAYTVTASTGQTCTTATTSCAVTGLSDATAYTFTVVATNGVGTSVASSSASATTAGVPGAPTSVTASSGASKQSVIAWAAPTSNGGSSITAYTATSNTGATCTTSSITCTITGLSDGTTYTFTVTATNVIGISNASTSASARTADVVVPPAPVDSIYAGQVSASPAPSMPAPAPSMPAPAPTPVVVVGNSDVKIPTVEIKPTEPVVTPPPAPSVEVKPTEPVVVVKPTTVKVDSASQKFISEVKIADGKVLLTPVAGFSGKKNVTVTINENGIERNVQIALTVLPEVVSKPTVTPIGMTKTTITWEGSPNAISYTIYLDRKKVCSISGTTCTVNRILGPKALVEIISNGGDKTISQRVRADLKVTAPILVGQLVSTTNTKSTLTPVDISTLNKIATVIKSQGFKTVMISEITTTKRTQAAAEARMAAIKKFIRDKTGISALKFEEIPVTSRTFVNKIMLKL